MPTLSIDIEARFAQAIDAVNSLTKQVDSSTKRMGDGFERVGRLAKLAFVSHEIKDFIADITAETIKAERAQSLLVATLNATGFAAGKTSKELSEMAERLSGLTVFDDEDIKAAEVALLRLGVAGKVFETALKRSADLAAQDGSNIAAAAEKIGRALADPIAGAKGLRGVMEPLTEVQKRLVEQLARTGDEAGKQKVILDQLAHSIGGSAQGENVGLYGGTKEVTKAWDDLLKTLGQTSAYKATAGATLDFLAGIARATAAAIKDAQSGFRDSKALLDEISGIGKGLPKEFDPEKAKAAAGQADRLRKDQLEAARKAGEENATVAAAMAKAGVAATLAGSKQAADVEVAALQDAYDRGFILTKDFYERRRKIIEEQSAAAVAAIDAELAAQNKLKAATTPEEKGSRAAATLTLTKERERILAKAAADQEELDRKAADSVQNFLDVQTKLNIELATQNGNLEEAARLQHALDTRPERIAFRQQGAPDDALIKKAQEVAAQGRFNKALLESNAIASELGRNERHIQDELERGEITTLGALAKTDEARQQAIEDQRRYLTLLEKAAAVASTAENREKVAEAKQQLDDLGAHAGELAKQTRLLLEDAFVDPFTDMIEGTKNAEEAFLQFVGNIAKAIERLAVQNLAQSLFGNMSGTTVEQPDNFLAGLIGKVVGSIAGAGFSGGFDFSGEAGRIAGGAATVPGGLEIPSGYSAGGMPQFNPQTVVPAGAGAPMINMNISTPDANSFLQSQSQITTAYAVSAQRALARR